MTRKTAYNSLVFLFAGGVIGVLVKHWPLFTFNFEVSVLDVLALIVTVFLAWWVAEKLEKDSDKERCEKDIIIEKLKAVDELVAKLSEKVSDSEIVSLTSIVAIIGNIDALSTRICNQIRTRYSAMVRDHARLFYEDELTELDNLCTDDADGEMVSESRDNSSVCLYSENRKADINNCATRLSDKIFNLEILINRA